MGILLTDRAFYGMGHTYPREDHARQVVSLRSHFEEHQVIFQRVAMKLRFILFGSEALKPLYCRQIQSQL